MCIRDSRYIYRYTYPVTSSVTSIFNVTFTVAFPATSTNTFTVTFVRCICRYTYRYILRLELSRPTTILDFPKAVGKNDQNYPLNLYFSWVGFVSGRLLANGATLDWPGPPDELQLAKCDSTWAAVSIWCLCYMYSLLLCESGLPAEGVDKADGACPVCFDTSTKYDHYYFIFIECRPFF